MPIIKVKNLTKKYNGLKAVDNISFEVKSGETFGILGPNGAGKTTTLEILEGLRRPTSGKAFIDKLSIKRDRDHIKEIIGVQLQATAFFEYLTVKEILELFADLYSNPIDVESLIKDVMLEQKKKSYSTQLSGGQKQRLSIASALVNNPKVIFLDEPTTGLDPIMSDSIDSLIKELSEKINVTSVVVTHDMYSVKNVAAKVAMMHEGKIHFYGTPGDLLGSNDSVITGFIKRTGAR